MAPTIDQLVKQAYELIDAQPDYNIPKLEQWKKNNNTNKSISACQGCGTPIIHDLDKHPIRCSSCRKKISELFRKRKNKKFFKSPVLLP